jgi:hypothetical protein
VADQCYRARAGPDCIAIQLAARIRQELLPALGVSGGFLDTGTRPKDPEAYDLYLHSLALPHDPGPNKDAIAVLQHVVEVDPTTRLPGNNSECVATMTRFIPMAASLCSSDRTKRSNGLWQLDPNRVVAAGQRINNSVERGELGKAYQAAQALVKRRPESA